VVPRVVGCLAVWGLLDLLVAPDAGRLVGLLVALVALVLLAALAVIVPTGIGSPSRSAANLGSTARVVLTS
jgi:hypothetical protein